MQEGNARIDETIIDLRLTKRFGCNRIKFRLRRIIGLSLSTRTIYKIPYRPDGEGQEFYMHEIENHGIQFYRLYFGENWAKFESVDKEYIADVLEDEELKHDTIITRTA